MNGNPDEYILCPQCRRMRRRDGECNQRYEVHCDDGEGKDMRVGWTSKADGGALAEMVRLHPSWNNPRVIDLHEHNTGSEIRSHEGTV